MVGTSNRTVDWVYRTVRRFDRMARAFNRMAGVFNRTAAASHHTRKTSNRTRPMPEAVAFSMNRLGKAVASRLPRRSPAAAGQRRASVNAEIHRLTPSACS